MTVKVTASKATMAVAAVLLLGACGDDDPTVETPGDTPNGEADAAGVSIVDNAFEPGAVEVAAGSTVAWTHEGAVPHTVTFEDGEDSGSLEPGDTHERTFGEAGEFGYVCSFHPGMEGTVTVAG